MVKNETLNNSEDFVDVDLEICEKLVNGEIEGAFLTENFAYVALRLTGTGEVERTIGIDDDGNPIKGKFVRYLEDYTTPELMEAYKKTIICVGHPKNKEGEIIKAGITTDNTIGYSIYPFVRGSEVWTIGKIFDLEAFKMIMENEYSTSPHFTIINKQQENSQVIVESPLSINSLAIVANGFWDQVAERPAIENSFLNFCKEEVLANPKKEVADSLVQETTQAQAKTEDKADDAKLKGLSVDAYTAYDDPNKKIVSVRAEAEGTTIEEAKDKAFKELDNLEVKEVADEKEKDMAEEKIKEEVKEELKKEKADETKEEVKEEVKEEETKEETKEDKADECKEDKADESKKEERKEDTKDDEERAVGKVIEELISGDIETDDDKEASELLEVINNIADEAEGSVKINKIKYDKRYKPQVLLKKFLSANKDLVDSKYHNTIERADQADYAILKEDALGSLKQKVFGIAKTAKANGKGVSFIRQGQAGIVTFKIN